MKAPSQIDALSISDKEIISDGTYPPLGFRPVWDAELGNGDYFGLYWPYGHEDREPIVCDMLHDEWGMKVSYSSVATFVEWLELNDWDRGNIEIDDKNFVGLRFQETKPLLSNNPDEAVSKLRSICEDFPESTEYWYTLASQLRRLGDQPGCSAAAVRAFASNWAFGMPKEGTLQLLRNAKGKYEHPLVTRSEQLTLQFGGAKENTNYRLIKECVSEYLSSATPVIGLLLNQNYGYIMSMETKAFQDRSGFVAKEWLEEQCELCDRYLGDTRTQIEY